MAARAQAITRRRRECERTAALSRTTPHDRAEHGIPTSVLHEEIDRLPERLRVLVVLCHLEGQTQELAAKTLSLPLGTVKSRLHRARDLLRSRLSRRELGCATSLLTPETKSHPADAIQSLPFHSSMRRAAAQAGLSRAVQDTLVSARAVHLFEETIKTMFLTRMRLGAALALLAGCIAAGASGVLAQQDPRLTGAGPATKRTRAGEISGTATGNAGASHRGAPSYVRRSRNMIVERLEQELKRTEAQLADVTARTPSPENDAVALHLRKTVEKLASLFNRIDPVLADAVDQFPTIFDFTTAQVERSATADRVQTVTPDPASASSKPAEPAATPPYDELSRAKAAERLEWARRMNEKGYVSKAQRESYQKEYESLKARIDADVARAEDRVDWARRMFEKGYVTKQQYDSEILRHYGALRARAYGEPDAVTDELLQRYELLKAKVQKLSPIRDDAVRNHKPDAAPATEPAQPRNNPSPF
jgi:Sigma-70, region 4